MIYIQFKVTANCFVQTSPGPVSCTRCTTGFFSSCSPRSLPPPYYTSPTAFFQFLKLTTPNPTSKSCTCCSCCSCLKNFSPRYAHDWPLLIIKARGINFLGEAFLGHHIYLSISSCSVTQYPILCSFSTSHSLNDNFFMIQCEFLCSVHCQIPSPQWNGWNVRYLVNIA